MNLLKKLELRNFKCFRGPLEICLDQGTYLIGANNSGKTAILQAIHCFFNSDAYSKKLLNQTDFARRQTGFNRSDISIDFDLLKVTGKGRRDRMLKAFGQTLKLTKSFTWREQSDTISVLYSISKKNYEYDQLDGDVRHLLSSVAISYIHPQEGTELLQKAQEKFKKRLFHNWGRHASVTERLAAVQLRWEDLRATANSYLSRTLTDKIRRIWPDSEVKIDLPSRIEDIVAISDITFRGGSSLPEVSLTAQGTGAQSIILYQTHFLLDSDRSLHPGMYFPIWLLEEPESFLHADIAFQIGRLLASQEWQTNIQMVVSTHSPIILSGSHQNPQSNRWVLFDRHQVSEELEVSAATDKFVEQIGVMLGDANFSVYFSSASTDTLVFLEDSRALTRSIIERAGIHVSKSLQGISEVKKYLDVYRGVKGVVGSPIYFVVDGDRGIDEIKHLLSNTSLVETIDDWRKYRIQENLYVVALPENFAMEDIFDEWPGVLDETIDDLLEPDFAIKAAVPARLSRVVDVLRRNPPRNREEARLAIRPLQDTKDRFWQRVEQNSWEISPRHAKALRQLLEE